MDSFARGFSYGLSGLGSLWTKGVRLFVLVPLLINALIFSLAISWFGSRVSGLVEAVRDALPSFLDWLAWLLWPLFVVAAILIFFFGFTLLANLIGSPFNGLLAEKVEDGLHSASHRPPSKRLLDELLSAPLNEIRKMAYFILLALPVLAIWLVLVFLLPLLFPLLPILWFAYGAWILAIEYLDYPMANWQLGFAEQRQLLRQNRMLALGFGAGVAVMTMIPVVNFVAMPAAVVGATRLWSDELCGRAAAGRADV